MTGGVCLLLVFGIVASDQLLQLCSVTLAPPEIGVGLTAFGLLFTVLGVLFFFDRGLLAMGNVSTAATCTNTSHTSCI